MGLREAKKDRTRAQLLEAALELIARQGFEQTTVNDIAAAVQVSPRTFLRYFPTKEDVIVSWVDQGMAILMGSLETRPPQESAAEALVVAAREMLTAYQARGKFFLVIERVIETSPQVAARKEQMMEALAQDVRAKLIQRARKNTQPALIYDVYTGAVFAMIRAAIRAWAATNGREPLVGLFDKAASAVRLVNPKS